MKFEESYHKAIALLHNASTEKGFVAALHDYDNYKRIWARDGAITSIAALLTNDIALYNTAKKTIETLFDNQHTTGFIPSNVAITQNSVSYGGIVGRVDNCSWAIIGLAAYTLLAKDNSLAHKYKPHVYKAFELMNAWEFNGKHIMYMPQSGDWADEYIHEGYTLGVQLLRLWALRLAAHIYEDDLLNNKALFITNTIINNYWKQGEGHQYFCPSLARYYKDHINQCWILGFNPTRVFNYFDLQANALILLLLPEYHNVQTISYVRDLVITRCGKMLPAFYPTIAETDADYEALRNNYAYTFKNYPDTFHNGGLWSVWNGFMSAALYEHQEDILADELRKRIHESNALNDYSFNEYLHGIDNTPSGVPYCTWSAAGAIITEQHETFLKIVNSLL
jgi:hypothetical protein